MSHVELSPNIGLLQAIVEAIGEADTEIGGLFSTRLTAPVLAGAVVLPVESTVGWLASGKIMVEGQLYSYASLTAATLNGIERDDNGTIVPGTARDHREDSEVVDLTRTRSALDQVRRALLVEYAEGDDLNTLGRNLNVLRSPFLGDDDRFRKIIKALAYNPRGTMFGLELALEGLVDAGNFEIFEDLVNFPCTVFIRLTGAATTEDISAGKAFANNGQARPAASDTSVVLGATPLTIQNVLWKDEGAEISTRTAKPSVPTIVEYVGQTPGPVWSFVGVSEAADVTVNALGYTEMADNSVGGVTTYERLARLQPESNADFTVLFGIPLGIHSSTPADVRQWFMSIHDTAKEIGIGILHVNPAAFLLGFTTGVGHIGTPVQLSKSPGGLSPYYSIGIHKRGTGFVELTVDGTVVDRVAYSLFGASALHKFVFGAGATGTSGMVGKVKAVEVHAQTLTDYWNTRGTGADVNSGASEDVDVNIPGHFLLVTDIGKQLETRGSLAINGQGGNNNGVWKVDAVLSGEVAQVAGDPHVDDATLQGAFPTRIVVGLPGAFKFPDDLGKKVEIAGSGVGNNGIFVIDKLLDPDTLVDLQAALTQNPSKTNVCEVVAGAFVTETGLDWQLLPDFVTESSLDWELSDAGSISGLTLLFRQPLPITTPGYERILNIIYTDVLSGQLVKDPNVNNGLVSEGPPPVYDYYPFYVSDPLGFVRSYLDAITAAGVIPEFLIV